MRICIVPEYPMSLMTGGLQVQAVETCKALSALGDGMTAELFDWSKTENPCDLYHFIGFPDHMHRIAELVRQAGRPYVVTMLLGGTRNELELRMSGGRRRISSKLMGKQGRDNAISGANRVITITQADARAAHIVFGVEEEKITVVPNGVADVFFTSAPAVWRGTYGNGEFVLCVGAIQERKNQLLLAQACNHLKLPLVLLGPVLPGQTEYSNRVRDLMRENEPFGGRWLQGLGNEDALLPSAYAACRVFALLSSAETQPLSVMQAMAAGKPILLLQAPYAEDKLFRGLPQAPSRNVKDIVDAVKEAWDNGQTTELPPDYSWQSVARQLQTIYHRARNPN